MPHICTRCGYEGKGRRILRGSGGMEMFLWGVLMVPGPFYSIWRRSNKERKCPHCERPSMVPLGSVEGQLVQRRIELEIGAPPAPPRLVVPPPPPPHAPEKPKRVIDPNEW